MGEFEDKAKKLSDVRMLTMTSIITGLSIVLGFFWNDAIRSTIDQIIPKGEGLFYKYAVALAVTIIVAIAILLLARSNELAERHLTEAARNAKSIRKTKEFERAKKAFKSLPLKK